MEKTYELKISNQYGIRGITNEYKIVKGNSEVDRLEDNTDRTIVRSLEDLCLKIGAKKLEVNLKIN